MYFSQILLIEDFNIDFEFNVYFRMIIETKLTLHKINMKAIRTAFMIFFLFSCNAGNDPSLVLPVKKVISKNIDSVKKILGRPDSTYNKNIAGKDYYIQLYQPRLTEIRYYKGKVEQIIINRPWDLPYEPQLIERFGIQYRLPDRLEKDAIINWKDIEGFSNVSFYMVGTPKPDTVAVNYKIFFTVEK